MSAVTEEARRGSQIPGTVVKVIVTHLMWVLGNKLGSSAGAVPAVKLPSTSPASASRFQDGVTTFYLLSIPYLSLETSLLIIQRVSKLGVLVCRWIDFSELSHC